MNRLDINGPTPDLTITNRGKTHRVHKSVVCSMSYILEEALEDKTNVS